ncbi:MAG TPA: heme-binding domain-containing protein [Candidatus Binataceae bacterium]|nr:heme-binding domain-containing protein [Candidatus Binataceae bacterium]
MNFGRLAWIAGLACIAAASAAQLVPVERINPPPTGTLAAPPEIAATLKRACYDCHSSATRWPWYSRVAPVSWLVVRDVNLGRKEVNFSDWGSYYPVTRRRKLEWIGRALREEKMPPWSYRLMHPSARLTEADRTALERWIESTLTTSPPPGE